MNGGLLQEATRLKLIVVSFGFGIGYNEYSVFLDLQHSMDNKGTAFLFHPALKDEFLSHQTRLVGAFARNKFLDAVVEYLYHIKIAFGIDLDRMGIIEITGSPAIHAPIGDELAVKVEFGKPVTCPRDEP